MRFEIDLKFWELSRCRQRIPKMLVSRTSLNEEGTIPKDKKLGEGAWLGDRCNYG